MANTREAGLASDDFVAETLSRAEVDGDRRLDRWRTVLDWYRLWAPPAAQQRSLDTRNGNAVVSCHEAWSEIASTYAAALQRPFVAANDVADVAGLIRRHGFVSATLFAPPQTLTWGVFAQLERALPVPWGVLTAVDAPGLRFLVSKLLLSGVPCPPTFFNVVVDGDEGRIKWRADDNENRGGPEPELAEQLTTLDFRALHLFAHGEAGHVNLHAAVMCGLLGDVEVDGSERQLEGCGVVMGKRRCKRAPGLDRRVISPRDLRARHLGLFSCTSASVDLRPYPSNVHAVLSALDGFATEVLAVRDAVVIELNEAILAREALEDGAGCSGIRELLNDVHRRRDGSGPYVLFGDAAGQTPQVARVGGTGALTVPRTVRTRVLTVPTDDPRIPAVVEVSGIGDRQPLVGRDQGVIITRGPEVSGPITVIDRTPLVSEAASWFAAVGRRTFAAARLERAVMRRHAPEVEVDQQLFERCDELHRLRIVLEQQLQAGLDEVRQVRATGRWSAVVQQCITEAAACVAAWDRAAAKLFASDLLSGDVFAILADALQPGSTVEHEACEHCGSPLVRVELFDPVTAVPVRRADRCRLCGERESVSITDGYVVVNTLSPIAPGVYAQIDYEIRSVTGGSPLLPEGSLVVQAFDKANRKLFVNVVRRASARGQGNLNVHIEPDVSGDLHYLWFVWVCGLGVSVLRRRWLCFRWAGLPEAT